MTLPIKAILSCLVILATVSNIRTLQQLQKKGYPKPLAILKDNNIFMGSGMVPGQLPIIAYGRRQSTFTVSVYIIEQKTPCTIGVASELTSAVSMGIIKQLPGRKIIFPWYGQAGPAVSVLSMDGCLSLYTKGLSESFSEIVPFVDGFDVITSENTRTSYNIDGTVTRKSEYFPINSKTFSISAVSEASRKGFFIVDVSNSALNLVTDNGELKKPLLKLPHVSVYSNNEQSMYSACWIDDNFVAKCFQYDQQGNEKLKNTQQLSFGGGMDVKNLPGGGLVFIAWNDAGNQLYVVEMGPKRVNIWGYSTKQEFQAVRLIDFNEKDRTVTLAFEVIQIVREVPEGSVFLQTYTFAP